MHKEHIQKHIDSFEKNNPSKSSNGGFPARVFAEDTYVLSFNNSFNWKDSYEKWKNELK